MKYYMPAKIWEEKDCIAAHASEIAAMGRNALLVTGRRSAERNGSLKDVQKALEENGCKWVLFNEVEENPSVETIMKARDLGISEGVDLVIGIGGGSPMDAAKAIAMMLLHKDADWTYLYDGKTPSTRLPLVLVPTTCGTGSEATGVSVLTRHDLGKKGSIPHVIFGDLALLDSKYLRGMPSSVLANTTLDAFCHLAESYLNTKATDYSRMCVDQGLKVWRRSKEVVLGKREATDEDYSNMLRASAMAGMAIAQTGTALPHGLGYPLTYNLGMAHGKACGFFIAGYLEAAAAQDRNYLLETAGFADTDALEEYYRASCGRDEVPESLLAQAAQDILHNPAKLANTPFAVTEGVLLRMCGL